MLDKERGSIAGVWITVLIIIFVTMLIYMTFYNLIAVTLYGLVVYYGGQVEVANNVVAFFKFFPVPFLFSILVWGVVSSFRRESDVYKM